MFYCQVYREQIKKAGDPLYRIHQCWEWVSVENPKTNKSEENKNTIETLSTILNLPIDYIIKHKGAWLVNISKEKDCFEKNIEKLVRKKNKDIPESGSKGTILMFADKNYNAKDAFN